MNKEKTIRQWLETLPDGYRERALKNYDPEFYSDRENLALVLLKAFEWTDAPEGYEFWHEVTDWALGRGELPQLPEEEK